MAITERNSNIEVELDISDRNSGEAGWTRVIADNDAAYAYRYSGGNHPEKNGHVKHKIDQGEASILVTMRDPSRYMITSIFFMGDDANQLSVRVATGPIGVIVNRCTAAMHAAYKVRVLDIVTNTTLLCDPVIRNVPNAN